MTLWVHRFLVVCLTLFSFTMAFGQDQDKDKEDQPGTLNIHIWDYCDPVSFARIGCVRTATPVANGIITLTGFSAELALDKSVGAWRFAPGQAKAEEGTRLVLRNLGGETHTFTRVKKFGGGFVAVLNAASGNPTPAPECAKVVNGNLVPQPPGPDNVFVAGNATANGPQVREDEPAKFQCCIHPWMRMTLNLKEPDEGQQDSH